MRRFFVADDGYALHCAAVFDDSTDCEVSVVDAHLEDTGQFL